MVFTPEKSSEPEPEKTSREQEREKEAIATVQSNYDELHKKILSLHKKNRRAAEIAKLAGCSLATVYNHLKQEA